MGGKAIKKWTDADKAWLRSRFVVNIWNGMAYDQDLKEIPLFKVGPQRKQYLAVSAKISGKWTKVRLHILVWFFATGEQSMKMIDHIEGDPTIPYHNRIDNLREATDKQNCANKYSRGYREYVKADGSIGYYALITWKDQKTGKRRSKRSPVQDTPEQALMIYRKWKKQRFGQFAFDGDVSVSSGCTIAVQ